MKHLSSLSSSSLPGRQTGVVLLSLMLVVLAAASYILLKGLNEGARKTVGYDQGSTHAVLKEAKAALIGYAVSYPDKRDGAKGPGRLPCPDYEYQGASDPVGSADSCSLGAGTETGLFPFHTLDSNEMFDASGARLWYAVSDNHRSNAGGVVNSDTPGAFSVDADTDVVAIIIAPGAALGAQVRDTSSILAQYEIANYLELENASTGDNLFTKIRSADINDQVMTITRGELMSVVENRVLSTVANALDRYFQDPDNDDIANVDPDCPAAQPQCDNGYPWLSPFSNPATSDFQASVGVREGHIPVVVNGRPFATRLNFDWDIPVDGTYANTSTFDPSNQCARKALCDVGGGVMTQLPIGDGGAICTWAGVRSLNCSTVEIIDLGGGDRLEREYIFEFTGIPMTIDSADAVTTRNLDYIINNGELPDSVTLAKITLNDNKLLAGGGSLASGSASLTLARGDAVTLLALRDISFDLEVDADNKIYPAPPIDEDSTSPGELPEWFFEDEWHQLTLVSYAQAEQPGDLAANCSLTANCLEISWQRRGSLPNETLTDVRGAVIVAGRELASTRPNGNPGSYFEGENATFGDNKFDKFELDANFNDQIKVLDPDG